MGKGRFTAYAGAIFLVSACQNKTSDAADNVEAKYEEAAANLDAMANNISTLADAGQSEVSGKNGTNWRYETSTDPMSDKPVRTACVRSSNEVQLEPPYEPTLADLCLRDHPQHGHDAYVQLEKDGQILCRSYENCTVRIRFDKREARAFSAVGASDGSSNIFFINDRRQLEAALKNTKTTVIQAEFYQAGNQAMQFDTAGFAWPVK